jgi:HAD superfamily hydrolase (TIGR01509 family)
MAIDFIFWDFGGVIVDDNVQTAFREMGVPYNDVARAAWRRHRLGITNPEEFYREAMSPSLYAHFGKIVQRKADELIRLKQDGALPVAKALAGKLGQGAISNHSREWGRYIVERWGLGKLLSPIIISADVGMDKSSEHIFRHALEQAGTAAESALFIDDKLENVNLARSIGMKGIHYTGRDQLVGDLRKYRILVQ